MILTIFLQMRTESFNLPVSYLRQFCFCRRIPYFLLVFGVNPPKPRWVDDGIHCHRILAGLMKRRDLSASVGSRRYNLKQEIPLESQSLGLRGVCDGCIFSDDGENIYPYEIKISSKNSLARGEKVQLCAYAMILEELFDKHIYFGFLFFGVKTKSFKILMTDDLRSQVLTVRDSILNDVQKGVMPDSDATEAKCSQCEFFNYCADRF